ncbi:ABC-type uncharacterized transport system [uncultured archaeon]|nr:ABC-type uncharacterized transport system [uncultured archaeon]
MRQILWFSIISLTAFWVYSLGIYSSSTNQSLAIISIVMGLLISSIGFSKAEVVTHNNLIALVIPATIASILVHYPYNIGFIAIAFGLLIYFFKQELKSVWLGILFSGVVLSAQAFILSVYYIIAPSYHDISWLSAIITLLLKLTGLDAASADGIVYIYGLEATFPFAITAEKMGIYPWILILIGAISLILITSLNDRMALRNIIKFFLISIFYIFLRYLTLVYIFLYSDMPQYPSTRLEIFTDPTWLLASFLPLLLLSYKLCPFDDPKFNFDLSFSKRSALGSMAIVLSVFLLVGACIFQDPGIEKGGRILVDEIHSIWEFSTLKLDKDWYGESSTYNAYSMAEWLKSKYHVDRIVAPSYINWSVPHSVKVSPDVVSDKVTYDILKNYDIFIIKTPSRFEPDEVDAIVRFVEDGGGLLLIGDHTNFGGTGTNLNQIARSFGIEFGFDAVNTQEGMLYYYKRGPLAHPCVKYMPYLDFMTGCSIKAPLNAEPVILGFGLNAIPGEYSSTGFFRETRQNDPTQITDTTWGLLYQAVALRYGKGKIVAFSDSTIISNFRFFFGGTCNFIAGCMEYLNRGDHFDHEKQILFILGLALGILAVYLFRMEMQDFKKGLALLLFIILLSAVCASFAILMFSTPLEDSIPEQFYIKNQTISFDGEHSSQIVSRGDNQGSYETFFIWTQRLGLTPTIEDKFDNAIEKGSTLVLIDPVEPLNQYEKQALGDYIQKGNTAVLLIESEGKGLDIVRLFNMTTYTLMQSENNSPLLNPDNNLELPIEPWGLTIHGGNALLNISHRVVLAEQNCGKGKFMLFTDSRIFRDGFNGNPGYMGYSSSDPASIGNLGYNLTALYGLEYYIFEHTGDVRDVG